MLLAQFLLPRKSICVIAVFLGLISFSCFGQPAFFPVASTPYDRQMNRVQPVLNSGSARQYGATSSSLGVYQWMAELRAMPYRYSGIWQTPAEVSLEQAADCKGKAVALYAQMRRSGARSAFFRSGTAAPGSVNWSRLTAVRTIGLKAARHDAR